MTKRQADEIALWNAFGDGVSVREAGNILGIPPNRVRYLCEKWSRKGIYDWGVTHDLGWKVGDPNLIDEGN